MNYIHIGIFTVLALAIIVIIARYYNLKRETDASTLLFIISLVILVIGCVMVPAYTAITYADAMKLPYEWESAHRNVEDTRKLLSKLEDIKPDTTNLGYAIQEYGNRLRTQLKRLIERENDIRADVNAWINNPLMPWSKEVRERIPDVYWEDRQ